MCVYLNFLGRFRQLLDDDKFAEAIQLADSMAFQHPRSIAVKEHLSFALWCQGCFVRTLEVLRSAESMGQLSPYAQLIYVHCLALRGFRRDALSRLKLFLSKTVLDEAELSPIARKFGELSEWRLALEVCLHLARHYPESASAWYGIGFYQEKLGMPPEATNAAFRNALLLSDCLCSRLRYAKNLSELERIEEAYVLIRSIDCCRLVKPWQREVVGQIYHAVGDMDMLSLLSLFDEEQTCTPTDENLHPDPRVHDTPQVPKPSGEEE